LLGMVQADEGFFNRVTMFGANGERAGIYNKIKLVPFGEYVPFSKIFSSIPALNGISDLQAGKEIKIFSYDHKNFGTLICFEDTFSDLCRQFAYASDFLVNVTNDAWFKGEPEASQHLGIMAMRAIENRISFVRCANSGISGTVSFRGEIAKLKQGRKETFFSGAGSFDVPLNSQRSIFNRIGDIFSLLCAIGVGIIFFITRRYKNEG
jgi:apolipoprotein N-acyltransferase